MSDHDQDAGTQVPVRDGYLVLWDVQVDLVVDVLRNAIPADAQ